MKYEILRENKFNQWVIIHLRYLLGVAFIPSGYTKLVGNRFTQISTDNPIGYFFEALYQSGFYYNALGLFQLLASFLLMTQRLSTLGNLIFCSLTLNICLITISLSFKGTWIITSLMLLASIILLIWDYNKLKPIFSYNTPSIVKTYTDPSMLWQILGGIYYLLILSFSVFSYSNAMASIVAGSLVILFFASTIYTIIRYRNLSKNLNKKFNL